jgi:hypothetical protein
MEDMKISSMCLRFFGFLLAGGMVLLPAPLLAVPLLEKLPGSHLDGLQSDAGSSPWMEGFSIPAAATLTKVSWWGYYLEGTEDAEAGSYLFSVDIGGSGPLSGTVTRSFDSVIMDASDPQFSLNLYRYELDLPNISFAGGSSTLEISNNSLDVVWLWQGLNGNERAFSIEGEQAVQLVPEPGILALLGIALMGWVLTSRRTYRYS